MKEYEIKSKENPCIKFADKIIDEIKERENVKVPNNCTTGEEFEKWMHEFTDQNIMEKE